MDVSAQNAVTEDLLRARSRKVSVAAPSTMAPAMTVADGFAIQRLQIEKRLANGERLAGWKIGALSAASRALGMTEPFLGPIFDSEINSSGAKLDRSRFFAPGAEPEIAFKIGRRLQGNDVRPEDLPASIEGALAALELVDCRLVDWFFAAADIPADCGLTAGAVVSDSILPITDIVLERETMKWFGNDKLVSTATGASVGGTPLALLPWLVAKLSEWDMALEAGDIVLAGALASHIKPAPSETLRAEFSHLGPVSVTFV